MSRERDSDFLIMMVKCLYDVKYMLHESTRKQLGRVNLISIKAYCSSCLGYITKKDGDVMYLIVMYLNAVIEFCTAKLSDKGFVETDIDEKEFIIDNINKAETELCLLAGKYYTDKHTFPYTVSLNPVYQHIIDTCINSSYYFGIDREIMGERK